jgi:hypothetical protein
LSVAAAWWYLIAVKAAGPFLDRDFVRRSLLTQLVLPCGDLTNVESIPSHELLRRSSVFSNIFARPDPLTACSCLAQCAGSEFDSFRSVFGPAVDFFSHVEVLGSCIDSALRLRFQEHATALSSSQLSRQLDLFFCPAPRISFLLQELDCGYCFLPTPLIVRFLL